MKKLHFYRFLYGLNLRQARDNNGVDGFSTVFH